MKLRAPTSSGVIKGILGLQLGIAGLMFGGDMLAGWRGLSFGSDVPRLETPVRPGDQTRLYRPGDVPKGPANRPFPATVDMPPRLMFDPLSRDGATVLRVTGAIAPGDGARFVAWLDEAGSLPDLLSLNSPGGSVADALEIGRTVRAAGLNTELTAGDICLSACPYILVAGVKRLVDDAGYVGVHQHYFGENVVLPAFMAVKDIQRGQGQVMGYLDEMGVDPLLMQHALVTPPDEIYILMPEELERYRIVTGPAADG